jgi:hypothetical protein
LEKVRNTQRDVGKRRNGISVAESGRMTMSIVVGVMVTWLTTTSGAQSSQASSPSTQTVTPEKPDKPLTLVGCVAADQANADQFTFADEKAGVTYRLNGTKLQTYNGRRVQIVGGLYPSANVAAQAGAIDPTKAAIAATTETGSAPLPEFHVKQVRQLRGSCGPTSPK